MRKTLLFMGVLTGWLHASFGAAQVAVNPFNQNNPTAPANSHFLPRAGGGYVGNLQNSAFGYNGGVGFNGFNSGSGFNGFNNGFGGFNGYGGFNGSPFNGYGSPFNN